MYIHVYIYSWQVRYIVTCRYNNVCDRDGYGVYADGQTTAGCPFFICPTGDGDVWMGRDDAMTMSTARTTTCVRFTRKLCTYTAAFLWVSRVPPHRSNPDRWSSTRLLVSNAYTIINVRTGPGTNGRGGGLARPNYFNYCGARFDNRFV